MSGKLRRLQKGRQRQKPRRRHGQASPRAVSCRGLDGGDLAGPVGHRQQPRGCDQGHVSHPGRDELLCRGAPGGDPIRIEQQQPVQEQAGGHPGEGELEQVAGQDQQQHRRQGQAQPSGEGPLPGLAIQIGRGIAHHHPADERHEEGHDRTDRVDAERKADPGHPDHRAVEGPEEAESDDRRHRRQHGNERCDLGEAQHHARSTTRADKAGQRAHHKGGGNHQGQEMDGQGGILRYGHRTALRGNSPDFSGKFHCLRLFVLFYRTI